jgi:hypothetical protein
MQTSGCFSHGKEVIALKEEDIIEDLKKKALSLE